MNDAPVFIPEDCNRVTIFREYRFSGMRLFFKFDLPNSTHVEISNAIRTNEQAQEIKALFDDWVLIESDDIHVVYERNAPR